MTEYTYQYGFSELHPDSMYDAAMREQKANKMLSVLSDFYAGGIETLSLLDIGCSTGIISHLLSKKLGRVVGIDIDGKAVKHAQKNYASHKLMFSIQDSMNLGFPHGSFDVAVCAHVYEHVPDANRLLSEIHRVLRQGGVCYFAAGNRLNLIECHYNLPLLSILPKPLAHLYLRALRRGRFYYENHRTLWGLKKLVSQFHLIDYTSKIIGDPQKFYTTELFRPGSVKQKTALWAVKNLYWLCPTYIWLLQKK